MTDTHQESHSGIRRLLMAAPTRQRSEALLESHLRTQVAQLLQIDPSEVSVETPFKNLGVGSLMALELTSRLEISLGFTLSATLLWNYATIASLASFLAEKISLEEATQETALPLTAASETPKRENVNGPATNGSDHISQDDLSPDDVRASLTEELAAIDDLLKGNGADS